MASILAFSFFFFFVVTNFLTILQINYIAYFNQNTMLKVNNNNFQNARLKDALRDIEIKNYGRRFNRNLAGLEKEVIFLLFIFMYFYRTIYDYDINFSDSHCFKLKNCMSEWSFCF